MPSPCRAVNRKSMCLINKVAFTDFLEHAVWVRPWACSCWKSPNRIFLKVEADTQGCWLCSRTCSFSPLPTDTLMLKTINTCDGTLSIYLVPCLEVQQANWYSWTKSTTCMFLFHRGCCKHHVNVNKRVLKLVQHQAPAKGHDTQEVCEIRRIPLFPDVAKLQLNL